METLIEMDENGLSLISGRLKESFKKFYSDSLGYLDKWLGFLAEYEDFGWIAFEEISFDKICRVARMHRTSWTTCLTSCEKRMP
uniref:Uncharacterized protein n=1 Tax=Globodera rostochiensis TaxID=31243 RepID=A0A914H795_GLORO